MSEDGYLQERSITRVAGSDITECGQSRSKQLGRVQLGRGRGQARRIPETDNELCCYRCCCRLYTPPTPGPRLKRRHSQGCSHTSSGSEHTSCCRSDSQSTAQGMSECNQRLQDKRRCCRLPCRRNRQSTRVLQTWARGSCRLAS